MPTFNAGYNTKIYVGAYDLSSYFNAAEAERTYVDLDSTTFGQTAKTRVPGLQDGSAKLSGFLAADVSGVQDAFAAYLGSTSGEPVSLGMIGDAAIGNPAYVWINLWSKGTAKSAVASLVATDAEFHARRGGLGYGFWAHPLGAETTTGNTAAGIDGTASTSTGWRASLHVTTRSGTSPTLDVKVQDNADNSTFADVTGGAFTQATAAGGQYLAGATGATLRRYVRILWTIGGTGSPSFTFAVAVARA